MKKLVLVVIAFFLMATAVPALAQQSPEQKNQCLLASKKCAGQVDDIQQRINKLNQEIQKGTRVYTPEELKKLQDKLTEVQQMLDRLEYEK